MLAWCIATAIYIIGTASGDGRRPARHTIDLMALALVWSWWMFWRPAKSEWGWAAALAFPLALVPCFPLFPLVLWRLLVSLRPAADARESGR